MSKQIETGAQVEYQYRVSMPGAPLVRGSGVVIGETIVGVQNAYIIKPADGSDCVHVRCSGVWKV